MYCKYKYNSYCNRCSNFVRTEKLAGDEKQLTLTIPERSLCNCSMSCICIAQPIPEEVGKDSILTINVGTTGYPVINQNGNFIYGDQLQSGRVYCFKFATDTLAFIYRGGWRLCKTKHAFTCVPIPPTPVKSKTKTANSVKPKENKE